jgi:hypothetical protein
VNLVYPVLIDGRISHERNVPAHRIISILTADEDDEIQYFDGGNTADSDIKGSEYFSKTTSHPECKEDGDDSSIQKVSNIPTNSLTHHQQQQQDQDQERKNNKKQKKYVEHKRVSLFQWLMQVSDIFSKYFFEFRI